MVIENLSELLYCRQFILSPRKINPFPYPGWVCTTINKMLYTYSHPYLPVTQVQKECVELTLLGYMLDPKNPNKSDKEILKDLLDDVISGKDILVSQEILGGRFIIIVSTKNNMFLFNDACGLRQVYYFIDRENQVWCCSQPGLLSEIIKLEPDNYVIENFVKKVFTKQKGYYWPGSLSEYSGVKKLLPNHFLNLKNYEITRFFPNEPISEISFQEGLQKAIVLLKGLMKSAIIRFPLAMPLTGGLDSRAILSVCRDFKEKIFYYTLLYPPNQLKSSDIVIPRKILTDLGLKHNLIDCRKSMEGWFVDLYKKNVSYAHSYWGDIAFGMFAKYPHDKVCIKGNCTEIIRCGTVNMNRKARAYYEVGTDNFKKKINIFISSLEWGKNHIAIKTIDEWLIEAKKIENDFNFNLLDLFFWEFEMGNWQAMSQLEWDIVQETFTPFNNRSLLSMLLSVDYKYRIGPEYKIHKEIINTLWPELLEYPVNPPTIFIHLLKKILRR